MRIGLVAGEVSGDALGAALITALRERYPDATFCGVGGPKMASTGLELWESSESLAVMGLTEVLKHLPGLLRLRARLRQRFIAAKLDVFVGIDAPEFNLGLAKQLKRAGIATVQYVSPQVWAWRQQRVRTIGQACDLILCLLPFEPAFYAEHGVKAEFVGHPLADQIPFEIDRAAARLELGLRDDSRVVALLPGSRRGEVERLGPEFAAAARWLQHRDPDMQFIAPMANATLRRLFETQCAAVAPRQLIRLVDGHARAVLAACDVAIVASGTATLETALSKRPMVVAYRLGRLTAAMLRWFGLVKVPHFSQPNLLASRELVPEFFQERVSGDDLGREVWQWFESPARVEQLQEEFLDIHHRLRQGGAALAARHIATLLEAKPDVSALR
ncbi:MAG TPA: lipid-A-disaccharide synthase [Steroidobacteraceae bacterium]|nr:lipid-A-disaccharide synthase [Steroidobacteraceae bacterium]